MSFIKIIYIGGKGTGKSIIIKEYINVQISYL